MSTERSHPTQGIVATAVSTDLIGAMVETVKGKRGVVRVIAVVVDPTFGPELHLWIEDRTDYGDDKIAAEHEGALIRVPSLGTRVIASPDQAPD
jgi:hypothetical protein